MANRNQKPKPMVGLWFGIGIVLGLSIGFSLNSFTLGLPMGLCASFLVAKVTDRLQYGLSRLAK